MEFRYEIPKHLEGFIGDIPEPQLNALMTFLFDYAIQHRMIDYPRSEIENSVDEIKQLVTDIQSKQSIESSLIIQLISNMNAQIASLHLMLSGGQMPPAMTGMAPVAFPQMFGMYQAAPTGQPYYQQPPQQGQQQPQIGLDESVATIEEEDIKDELWKDSDENASDEQRAFEDEMFK